MRSVAGVLVYNTWNPCVSNSSPFDVITGYPGDDVVDVIALDTYSPVWPMSLWDWQFDNGTMAMNVSEWSESVENREHYWSYPAANETSPTSLSGMFPSLSLFFIVLYL